jgi:DNA-binding NtrC family response regulator
LEGQILSPQPADDEKPVQQRDLKSLEKDYLRQLLNECDGDKVRAAEMAGISVRTLYRKINSL